MELFPFGLKFERLSEVRVVQVAPLLLVRLSTAIGPSLAPLGHNLHFRVVTFEAVPVFLHQLGHQGRPLLRPRNRGHEHPHHRFPGPVPEKLRVERLTGVLVHLVVRRMVYPLLLPARPLSLPPHPRHLVGARLPRRVPLVNLYR